MTRKRRPQGDPIEQEIELSLNPGAFIPDRACFSFVSDLDEVAARIAELVRQTRDDELEDLSHYATEPVAKKFDKAHPDLAARLWRAQGLRIVKARKSEYYDAALSNFERAKRCFERSGLHEEWNKTVRQVRADHHRKSRFMPGFERLVAGVGPNDEPSFLDRAKPRWNAKDRRAR